MNAPSPVLGNSRDIPRAAQIARLLLQKKMARGLTMDEANAEIMEVIPRSPGLPPDHTMSGKKTVVQLRINALAKAVEAAPGSTKLQLRTATGLSEWQFQRAIDRLVLDGRVRKQIDQRLNLGHYWPTTPKGTADT